MSGYNMAGVVVRCILYFQTIHLKDENVMDNGEISMEQLAPENRDDNLQTSPYFKRTRSSSCQLEIHPKTKSTEEQMPNDFHKLSPRFKRCLSPKLSRLRNFREENTFFKSSTGSAILRIPGHDSTPSSSQPTPTPSPKPEIKDFLMKAAIPNDFKRLPPGLQNFYNLNYTPPKSPFNLIQEELYVDPWKLLVATIFLNKTGGRSAIRVLWTFFQQFPDAHATSRAEATQIEGMTSKG